MSLLCCTLLLLIAPQPRDPQITPKSDPTQVEVRVPLSKEGADKLPAGKVSQDDGEKWLKLCLITGGKDGPAMLGSYERHGQTLVFVPRLPLQRERTYHAVSGQAIASYTVPAKEAGPPPQVVAVWPTGDMLPANHLRFHIEFSAVMRGGEDIFDQIELLDDKGRPVVDPWLHEELWNEAGTHLTLYIHPGRIKWGVLLRELLGAVLEPNRSYTLVLRGSLLDADGGKLGKDYTKKFKTTAEDRTRINLGAWKLTSPAAGTREALKLTFATTLDHVSAAQFLKVLNAKGQSVIGKVEVGRDGRSWSFQPADPWAAQDYKVAVDERLEDVAGNTPLRPFDMDLTAPVPPPQKLTIPFHPGHSP